MHRRCTDIDEDLGAAHPGRLIRGEEADDARRGWRSRGREAAVDRPSLADDKGRLVGGEKQGNPGNLLGLADPADRMPAISSRP